MSRPGGRLASSAGFLIALSNFAPAACVDFTDSTKRRQFDDHVALTGMQVNPGQDTDNLIIVAAWVAVCLVSDLGDVRRVYLEAVQLLANLRLAVFPRSCCFGRRDRQKKKPEREADSEDGVQCETFSRVQPTKTSAHNMIATPKAQECSQSRGKQRGGAFLLPPAALSYPHGPGPWTIPQTRLAITKPKIRV